MRRCGGVRGSVCVWRGPGRSGLVEAPKRRSCLVLSTPLLFLRKRDEGAQGRCDAGEGRGEMVEALLLSRSGLGPLLDELAPMRVWSNGAWAGRGEGGAAGGAAGRVLAEH